ncbi:hypothetical protein P170DRAFT_450831 [Aspergillus steynii IBT 23096]|uniref:Atos-like conserved domain-containing protein n=1 Tax=Aspergillus steynii IBT 23096 TaxID=1392250 RepID=A0A2I2FSI3_9EURO|nr:uncharacterized protein P170DRAFT_450831 [Aspergillus steynii IBT 23096]PLB43582.1 hypothetical protein P170DRAFT_450831 [Aspergillus steynii IBT 23096]
MPIFQDPDRQQYYDLWSDDHHGPDEDARQHASPSWKQYQNNLPRFDRSEGGDIFPDDRSWPEYPLSGLRASDREELIRYLKGTDSSPWVPQSSFGDPSAGHFLSDEPEYMENRPFERSLPNDNPRQNDQELGSPADIVRPRSALHSGDFREGAGEQNGQQQLPPSPIPRTSVGPQFPPLSSSPTTPWFAVPTRPSAGRAVPTTRSRAPSLGSFSSSYVLKAPTSPLVYQANNTDLDFSPRTECADQTGFSEKANRRRTLPPETFRHLQSSPTAHRGALTFQNGHPLGGWNEQHSHRGYNPRRSLTSTYSLQLASSVQTPSPRARRLSITSESSPRPHASLVGSYEESILRGRMSMNPSKPLDFTAQIGVLGKSKCKSSLKCPPHVTVPFPAVFYSYPTSGYGRSISDDNPSPYVGLIDLDNSLPRDTSASSRRRRHHPSPAGPCGDQSTENNLPPKLADQDALRKREKRHRRAESPKCPPGGCYRIPQQGQLQIMIKNPNKTAVKLFLVPYDLSDMEPGTKTFIRQRSYSAGPIIDMPLTARKNYGTDRPEASLNPTEDPKDKPILRYLIHLNICCPSRGRFYLHSSIRVVFANRVPDGKEQLRNEIQHPDPRYTPYKPIRDVNHSHAVPKPAVDRGFQRSAANHEPIVTYDARRPSSDLAENSLAIPSPMRRDMVNHGQSHSMQHNAHPFQPIPSLREEMFSLHDLDSIESHRLDEGRYHKLNKGDIGYGGYPSVSGSEAGESLLAKRLRGLDVHKHDCPNLH